jgi:flagellar M-ring protein FliF
VLRTRGAGPLPKSQIAAVLNLVASAVPGLKPTRISIIDQAGNLLARGNGDNADSLTPGSSAEEQRVAYETQLSQNVEEMLERSLGYGHVRVDVNADMDFDRVTTSQETYDPDGQVVRSTQSNNELNEADQAQAQEQPATVQNNLPGGQQTGAGAGAGAAPKSKDNKQEETTNYEISKKVVNQVREAGVVKRLSVAVLVDGNYTTDKGVKSYQPRSAEEIAALTKLVQSAIGFDDKRGDRVEVIGMKFAEAPDADTASSSIILGLDKSDLFRIGEAAGLLLLALVTLLFVIRPLLNRLLEPGQRIEPSALNLLPAPGGMAALPPPGGADGDAPQPGTLVPVNAERDAMIDISQVEGRVRASSMKKIGEIVEKHPEEAVAILRNWMYQTS